MPLLARTVATPLHIDVRRGAVAGLGELLADQRISAGGDVAVVVGPGQGERIADAVQLDAADIFTVAGGTLDAAVELADKLRARSYDAVVGIGGGTTLDTAKYAATRYGIPMVSVATSLAHDGIASPVAILDHDGVRGSYGVQLPIAVVVDLDYVDTGPQRAEPGRHRRDGEQRVARWPTGSWPGRCAANRSTGSRSRCPGSAPRRCSATRATCPTTTS